MKRIFLLALCVFALNSVFAQCVYTKPCSDRTLERTAKKWMKKREWRNGFTAASPHKTVNAAEFYTQYQKNKVQWDAAFGWLATHDLLNLPKGNYPIEGTSLTASIQDDTNGPLAKRQSESHYHHIDLQYAVKGVEGFGIIEQRTSKPNCDYKPDVIHYDYDLQKAKFYNSCPGRFFLFFPGDWHIAKVQTGKKDQHIRVVVIKLDYVD